MRKIIYKAFWIWNFDKEEAWLNELASRGLLLVNTEGFKYIFEESTPDEYAIRLELLENLPSHTESVQYIKFIEETGAEYLGSYMRWVYFRKRKTNGDFNIFSDCDSRIKHLNRILLLLTAVTFLDIGIALPSLLKTFTSNTILPANIIIISTIALALISLFTFGLIKLFRKRKRFIKEKQIFEC